MFICRKVILKKWRISQPGQLKRVFRCLEKVTWKSWKSQSLQVQLNLHCPHLDHMCKVCLLSPRKTPKHSAIEDFRRKTSLGCMARTASAVSTDWSTWKGFLLPPGHCLSSSPYGFYFTLPLLNKVSINIFQHLICLMALEVSLQDLLTPRKTVQNIKMLVHSFGKENQRKCGNYDSDSSPKSFSVSFLLDLLLLKQSPYLSHLAQNSLINSD